MSDDLDGRRALGVLSNQRAVHRWEERRFKSSGVGQEENDRHMHAKCSNQDKSMQQDISVQLQLTRSSLCVLYAIPQACNMLTRPPAPSTVPIGSRSALRRPGDVDGKRTIPTLGLFRCLQSHQREVY